MIARSVYGLVSCFVMAIGCSTPEHTARGSDAGSPAPPDADTAAEPVTSSLHAEDPAQDAPALALPDDISKDAAAIVNASTFGEALASVHAVLGRAGVAVRDNSELLVAASAPATSETVDLIVSADLSLEARDRKTSGSLSATQLAEMFVDLGWQPVADQSSGAALMQLLAAWTRVALQNPSAPESYPILIIAANNQLQTPRANLSLPAQDPDFVRFSLLDLLLLSAAVDRVSEPALAEDTTPGQKRSALSGACDQLTQVPGVHPLVRESFISVLSNVAQSILPGQTGPELLKGHFSAVLSVTKLGSRIWKFAQIARYGTLSLALDTENPTRKPLPSAADKFGALTARAGVDPAAYREYVDWLGNAGKSGLDSFNACLKELGLPTKTDIADVARDVDNWRVSWDIVSGGGSQVLFKRGQQAQIASRWENKLVRINETEASDTMEFQVLPQLTETERGDTRRRHALFSAQLHRGKPLDPTTFFAIYGAAEKLRNTSGSPLAQALALAKLNVDLAANWILEVASPKRYVTQELIEIVPKGWVGSIVISEVGTSFDEQIHEPETKCSGAKSQKKAKVKFESRFTLMGSEMPSAEPGMVEAFGEVSSTCEVDYRDLSTLKEGYEGCTTVCPARENQQEIHMIANWGARERFAETSARSFVQLTTFPKEMYEPIKQYLPPEIVARIGTYQLVIGTPGCGVGTGATYTTSFRSAVDRGCGFPDPEASSTFEREDTSVGQGWQAPFPSTEGAAGSFPLIYVGRLDERDLVGDIDDERVLRRVIGVPGTANVEVPTQLRVQIRLRRAQ